MRLPITLSILLMLALSGLTQSVPSLINYQGKLTDPDGNPLPVGIYGIQFRIWDSATATNGSFDLIWGQQQNAAIQSNGVFNVILGSPGASSISGATPAVNNLAYAFTGSNCFLGVTIVATNGIALTSPIEIVPRQQLLSVPYAIVAQQVVPGALTVTNFRAQLALDAITPPGTISAFGGANVPTGWLLCDGSVMSSSQFPRLYSAISTNWGAGTSGGIVGTNDFNLPDLRGMFLRGVNGSRVNDGSLNSADSGLSMDPDVASRVSGPAGGSSGNAVGSLQGYQLQSHTHGYGDSSNYGSGAANAFAAQPNPAHFFQTASTGGAETRPQNAYVNYIIKY